MEPENVFKVILVGDQGVGKSSILQRYIQNAFVKEYTVTIGLEFSSKKTQINDQSVTLQIWDTAGQEAFKSIVRSFFRNTQGIILVYNIGKRDSFTAVDDWVRDIRENTDGPVTITLVGNKTDLEDYRQVTLQEGQAKQVAISADFFFECSALDGTNVEEIFFQTVKNAYEKDSIKETDFHLSKAVSKSSQKIIERPDEIIRSSSSASSFKLKRTSDIKTKNKDRSGCC